MRALRPLRLCSALVTLLALWAHSTGTALADPQLRVQVSQPGDFIIIGNVLAQDCSLGTGRIEVGTVGACGSNSGESGADVFWRSNANDASASTSVTAAMARSTAVLGAGNSPTLQLPAGGAITHARLYWAATLTTGSTPAATATLERPGVFSTTVTADGSVVRNVSIFDDQMAWYQATADVTDLVSTHGTGPFRVGGISSRNLNNLSAEITFAGWALVILYTHPGEPVRNLTIFDGLDTIGTNGVSSATVALSGFLVPPAGFDAKLGVIAWEGDSAFSGDRILFNGAALSNNLNPADNTFNATRSVFGVPVSVPGDLPQMDGTPGSMSGMDLDVFDITQLVRPGDTSASITASSTLEAFGLGAFVTSLSTLRPNFSSSVKQVVDLDQRGNTAVVPGDTLEYTITVTNSGRDASVHTVFSDPLPVGLTYVPGSLRLDGSTLTDTAGDDLGRFDGPSRTLTVNLGQGATATAGGRVAIGETHRIVFRARIDQGVTGALDNQGFISFNGERAENQGQTELTVTGTSDGNVTGPTRIQVDQCGGNDDCPDPSQPTCETGAHLFQCRACQNDRDCQGNPRGPACATSGPRAGQCVPCTDNSTCTTDPLRICDVTQNVCVGCQSNADCPLPGQPICDRPSSVCRACDVNSATDCALPLPACESGGPFTGQCRECTARDDSACRGTARPLCDTASDTCVQCLVNSDCPAATPLCNGGTCVARCNTDSDCPTETPVCAAQKGTRICVECTPDNSTRCPADRPLCDPATSTCVACVDDDDCSAPTPRCLPGTGTCGQCTTGSDCPDTAPGCQPDGTCGACQSDQDCRTDPTRPACDTGSGQCVECTPGKTGNSSLCSPQNGRPVCLPTDVCGCNDDTDCGGPGSGRICDASKRVCVDGCRPGGTPDVCPKGQACDSTGQCGGGPCLTNSDCRDPGLPYCNLEPDPHVCVRCLEDSHCPQDQVCDPESHRCVECTPENDKNCSNAPGGSICLPVDRCGCQTDSDCGGPRSGRVCDGSTSSCKDGCRGKGGNMCPKGLECTSMDSTIGSCEVPDCQDDSDCGGPTSGRICDDKSGECKPGCRGEGGNGCPDGKKCSSTTTEPGMCGKTCTTDSDCGGPRSGRICDDDVCVDGCRGEGGNGCPRGEVCTSDDTKPGDCRPGKADEPGQDDAYIGGGGCGCTVTSADSARGNTLLAGLVLGLWVTLLRRRRSRR